MEDIDGVESEADGGAEERTRANITRLMNRLAVALALQVFAHAAVRRALKRSLRARCWTCGAAMIQGFGVGFQGFYGKFGQSVRYQKMPLNCQNRAKSYPFRKTILPGIVLACSVPLENMKC